MSWEIFKQNILRRANSPDSIQDVDTVAKLWATEYDACMKRGGDVVNRVAIKKGNTEIMEQLFRAALLKGQSSTAPFDLVGELGKGVIAYWTGAIMNEFPIPLIPAPGSIQNIAVTSNIVVNAGVWIPPIPSPPLSVETQSLLQNIPDDNNTFEGAQEVVQETGVEFLTDGGDVGGQQLEELKNDFPPDNPPFIEVSSEEAEIESEKIPDPKDEGIPEKQIKCDGTMQYDTKISDTLTLADLTIKPIFPHKLKEQRGYSKETLICNLQNLAQNIIEPLKAKYSDTRINSAFRGTPSIPGGVSQHEKGEAVDVQFPGISNSEYLSRAKWVAVNLPVDQIIFEHGNSIWLHISTKRDGNQRGQKLTMYEGKYEPGFKLYYKN
jgi:hypothetical protein